MYGIFILRSPARCLFSIVIGRNCFRESLQTAVQPPLERKRTGSVSLKGLLAKAALYQINFNFYCCGIN